MKFHPKKSLGQNFLINKEVVQKIIATAELSGNETVLEVGPGKGILTEALLLAAKKVIAIEKDKMLFKILAERFAYKIKEGLLELTRADALETEPPEIPYFLVANIPYIITSPLLDHYIRDRFMEARGGKAAGGRCPLRAILMVQKEVAQKLCSRPPRMNVLALHIQTFAAPQILFEVSKNNFFPRPKVDSAVIRIDFPGLSTLPKNLTKYFELIHKAFGQKRKMLRSTLPAEILEKAEIDPKRRPETLSVEEWKRLSS